MSRKVPGEKPGLLIHYTVDGEEEATTQEALTPRDILESAGLNPETHVLVAVTDGRRHEFRGRLDEPISLHEHSKFLSEKVSS
jgi:hypothetical protein